MTKEISWKPQALKGLSVEREAIFGHPTITGLRLRVLPTGVKTWQWTRMASGKRLRQTLGQFPAHSLHDAQEWATGLNMVLDRGDDPLAKVVEAAPEVRMTVREAMDHYLEDCARRGVKRPDYIQNAMAKDVLPVCGKKNVRDVTPADILKAIQRPLDRGAGRTAGQTRSNAVLNVSRTFFLHCVNFGLDGLEKSPAGGIKRIPASAITGSRKKRPLTLRETALLILAGREFDRRREGQSTVGDIVALIALFGSRKSEIYTAMAEEWDGEAQVWTIPARRYKTGVEHRLPAGPVASAIFDRLAAGKGGYLIPAQRNIRTGRDCDNLAELLSIMEGIAGETIPRWTMHDIRYGFRRNVRLLKIADSELAERIIHPKAVLAMDEHYEGDRFDEMREALTAWEKAVMDELAALVAERVQIAA